MSSNFKFENLNPYINWETEVTKDPNYDVQDNWSTTGTIDTFEYLHGFIIDLLDWNKIVSSLFESENIEQSEFFATEISQKPINPRNRISQKDKNYLKFEYEKFCKSGKKKFTTEEYNKMRQETGLEKEQISTQFRQIKRNMRR